MRSIFVIVSILLASCSEMAIPKLISLHPYKVEVRQGNLVTPEMLDKIRVGMPAPQVRAILGTPLIQDPFHANRWDYVYSLKQGGQVEDQQRLTLYFDKDNLARIDDSHMPRAPAASGADAGNGEK
jgi:outer membrane protein assembly factor BamE